MTTNSPATHLFDPAASPSQQRLQRLLSEAAFAWNAMPPGELTAWARDSAAMTAAAGVHRVKGIASMAWSLVKGSAAEAAGLGNAIARGYVPAHLTNRAKALASTATEFAGSMDRSASAVANYLNHVARNPAGEGPRAFGAVLAFLLGSGGLDGDGGLPDTDITLLGIGSHRSPLTHSLVMGAVAEGVLSSGILFIERAYPYLPRNHDPLWDVLRETSRKTLEGMRAGVALGIGYHLAVDAVIEPAAYKDLPFSMPLEGHQTAMAASAVTELRESVRHLRQQFAETRSSASPSNARARIYQVR